MEVVKWVVCIVGIFVLLLVGIMMFMKSEEKQKQSKKTYRETTRQIKETNQQLDETLKELKAINPILEKVSDFFNNINTKILKK